jgi:hypothetical protein
VVARRHTLLDKPRGDFKIGDGEEGEDGRRDQEVDLRGWVGERRGVIPVEDCGG